MRRLRLQTVNGMMIIIHNPKRLMTGNAEHHPLAQVMPLGLQVAVLAALAASGMLVMSGFEDGSDSARSLDELMEFVTRLSPVPCRGAVRETRAASGPSRRHRCD